LAQHDQPWASSHPFPELRYTDLSVSELSRAPKSLQLLPANTSRWISAPARKAGASLRIGDQRNHGLPIGRTTIHCPLDLPAFRRTVVWLTV